MTESSRTNPLAVWVIVAATALALLGKVDAEAVLYLLTGLAIPAKASGYTEA